MANILLKNLFLNVFRQLSIKVSQVVESSEKISCIDCGKLAKSKNLNVYHLDVEISSDSVARVTPLRKNPASTTMMRGENRIFAMVM